MQDPFFVLLAGIFLGGGLLAVVALIADLRWISRNVPTPYDRAQREMAQHIQSIMERDRKMWEGYAEFSAKAASNTSRKDSGSCDVS